MKDIQGIQRGKCNNCECSEYRTAEGGSGGLACEYCGHRPVEHVRIVALGRCRTKGCDCDKYASEDPNSYSDCEYCGCKPSTHEGADALRKKPPASQFPQSATVPVASVVAGQRMMTQPPPTTAMGQPGVHMSPMGAVQTMSHGTCALPGCPYGRRVEGSKIHAYCSRTCAQKHGQMQSSFHAQKIASANQAAAMAGATPAGQPMAPQPSGGRPQAGQQQPQTTTGQPPAGGGGAPAVKMCKNCNAKPANPGRGWCEACYRTQQLKLQGP